MIEVQPAVGRFEDVSAVLRPRSNPDKACWCLTYRMSPAELNAGIPGSRPAAMSELCSRDPGPGLVAYLDGAPVGWCGVGPRSDFHRLTHSRTIQHLDDVPAWSVVCLVVASGHRGKGIAAAMLKSCRRLLTRPRRHRRRGLSDRQRGWSRQRRVRLSRLDEPLRASRLHADRSHPLEERRCNTVDHATLPPRVTTKRPSAIPRPAIERVRPAG